MIFRPQSGECNDVITASIASSQQLESLHFLFITADCNKGHESYEITLMHLLHVTTLFLCFLVFMHRRWCCHVISTIMCSRPLLFKCQPCFRTHTLCPPWHGTRTPALQPVPFAPTAMEREENRVRDEWKDTVEKQKEMGQEVITHRGGQVGHSLDVEQLLVDDLHVFCWPLAWTDYGTWST